MSLLKKARKIKVDNKTYKWDMGKNFYKEEGYIYSRVYIQTPEGIIKEFEECMGTTDVGIQYPITPDTIKNLIIMYEL